MKHISVTYFPARRLWQVMTDGPAPLRAVRFNGPHADAIEHALKLGEKLGQPVYEFNREGYCPRKISD